MKIFIQMMLKGLMFIICLVFLSTKLSYEISAELRNRFLTHLLQINHFLNETSSLNQMNDIEKQWNETNQIEVPLISENKKKIYLYNTHQSEEYIDGITIFEVTYQFAQMLKHAGFDVIFETSDFMSELNEEGLKYNQLYTISRRHIAETLEKEGPFDLIVDVHRDSAKRSVSVIEADGVVYGRLMFVIGNKSSNVSLVSAHSHSLTDKMNQRIPDIMREPFIRQSVYNQDMADYMLLLEVGSDQNTSSEVLRSLEILVDVLQKEGLK